MSDTGIYSPITFSCQQSSEEEILLRRVLYDAVLLGELPFLKSGRFSQLHESHLKNIFLAWLLVADNAIEFARYMITRLDYGFSKDAKTIYQNILRQFRNILDYREYGAGQGATTVSYTEAFSRSDIPNMLIESVANQISMKEKLSRPNTTTPKALISKSLFYFMRFHLNKNLCFGPFIRFLLCYIFLHILFLHELQTVDVEPYCPLFLSPSPPSPYFYLVCQEK